MSNKQGQELLPNYMDGVKVKISEQYKPPPRINLPMSYSQRLLLNKQIQGNIGHYNFSLEKTVKDRMNEWKAARVAIADQQKHRLEKIKEFREKTRLENLKVDVGENEDDKYMTYLSNVNVLIPTVAATNCADVLTPMPLTDLNSQPYICKPIDKSPFNISEFEADTSSPFDNVELKTINDMAELALVLQNDDKNQNTRQYSYMPAGVSSYPYTSYDRQDIVGSDQYSYLIQSPTTSTSACIQPTNSSRANGYCYGGNTFQLNTYATPYSCGSTKTTCNSLDATSLQSLTDESKLSFRRVPDIMKALETELNHTPVSDKKNNQIKVSHFLSKSESAKYASDSLEDPYKILPKNLQQLSKSISGMGFPLPRVARTCKLLGDDEKKVVEHLLAMSELLDLGFSESEVSSALFKCDNDRDKALDMLIL